MSRRNTATATDRTAPRFGIEVVKVVREVQAFHLASGHGVSIGERVDQAISEAIARGDELQSITVHLDDPNLTELMRERQLDRFDSIPITDAPAGWDVAETESN